MEKNQKICLDILNGKKSSKANLVYLNAGAALYIYGLAESIKDGYYLAQKTAQSKKSLEILEQFEDNEARQSLIELVNYTIERDM